MWCEYERRGGCSARMKGSGESVKRKESGTWRRFKCLDVWMFGASRHGGIPSTVTLCIATRTLFSRASSFGGCEWGHWLSTACGSAMRRVKRGLGRVNTIGGVTRCELFECRHARAVCGYRLTRCFPRRLAVYRLAQCNVAH